MRLERGHLAVWENVRLSRRRDNSRLEWGHLAVVGEREIFPTSGKFDPPADPLRVRPSRGRSRGRSLTMQMTGLVDARIVRHVGLLPSDTHTLYQLTRLSDRPRTRAPGRPWQMCDMSHNSSRRPSGRANMPTCGHGDCEIFPPAGEFEARAVPPPDGGQT